MAKHSEATMENFKQIIRVNGVTQYYKDKKHTVKRHGIKQNGEPRKIRKDKTSTKPTKVKNT